MWEALVVAGLVAAFLAVAGIAGLTVYRLWSTSGSTGGGPAASGGPMNHGGAGGTSRTDGPADSREG